MVCRRKCDLIKAQSTIHSFELVTTKQWQHLVATRQ